MVGMVDPSPAQVQYPESSEALTASRHRTSGKAVFPRIPEKLPAAAQYDDITLSMSAILYSYTIIHPNPKSGLTPFILVYADFPEDARLLGRLEMRPNMTPAIGMKLAVITKHNASNGMSYYFISHADNDHA